MDGWRRRIVSAPQFHENHVLTETFAFNLLMGRRWPPSQDDLTQAEEICRELGLGDVDHVDRAVRARQRAQAAADAAILVNADLANMSYLVSGRALGKTQIQSIAKTLTKTLSFQVAASADRMRVQQFHPLLGKGLE